MLNIDQLLGIEITPGKPFKIYHPVHRKEIYYKNSYGYEYWKEYDSSGKLIHFKNSEGHEEWREHDYSGNRIHYKCSDGYEEWRERDSQGNLVYQKVNDKVYLDNRKKSLTKSEIAEKLGISVEDVENAQ